MDEIVTQALIMVASLPKELLLFVFVCINLESMRMMYLDKRSAQRGQWRIAEVNFAVISFFGGLPGLIVGSQMFRHKTKKPEFWFLVTIPFVLGVCLFYKVLLLRNN